MAKDLEVSPSYLCRVENGLQAPSQIFRKICAEYLEVTLENLFPQKINKKKLEEIGSSKNKLWLARKKKNIKQNELAKNLGCTPSFLCKVEKGQKVPSDKFKKKCAKILKIKEVDLF